METTVYSSSELVSSSLSPTQSLPSPSVSATPSLGIGDVSSFIVITLTPAYLALAVGFLLILACFIACCIKACLKSSRVSVNQRNESTSLLSSP